MKSDRTNQRKNEQRVELKYCEGCGGLGVRECGGGQVYCDDCARKLAELPVSTTPSRRPILPVGRRSTLGDCTHSSDEDSNDLDAMACFRTRSAAAGGAA
jgi:hypothetical protein